MQQEWGLVELNQTVWECMHEKPTALYSMVKKEYSETTYQAPMNRQAIYWTVIKKSGLCSQLVNRVRAESMGICASLVFEAI